MRNGWIALLFSAFLYAPSAFSCGGTCHSSPDLYPKFVKPVVIERCSVIANTAGTLAIWRDQGIPVDRAYAYLAGHSDMNNQFALELVYEIYSSDNPPRIIRQAKMMDCRSNKRRT